MIEQIFCSCCYSVVIVACRKSILNYFAAQLSYFARAAQQKHEVLRAHASTNVNCQYLLKATRMTGRICFWSQPQPSLMLNNTVGFFSPALSYLSLSLSFSMLLLVSKIMSAG